jgi:hypothetical protein
MSETTQAIRNTAALLFLCLLLAGVSSSSGRLFRLNSGVLRRADAAAGI